MISLLLALATLLAGCAQVERPPKKAEEKKVLADGGGYWSGDNDRSYTPKPSEAYFEGQAKELKVQLDLYRKAYDKALVEAKEARKQAEEWKRLFEKAESVESAKKRRLEDWSKFLKGQADTRGHFYAPQSTPMYGRTP